MKRIIAPSLLSADFGNLEKECRMINSSAASWFHIDVMDGVFVPNIAFGFPACRAVAAVATKPMDAHLMIIEPWKYVERYAKMGVKYLSVHYEACPGKRLKQTINLIHSFGMNAGVAICPETPAEALSEVLRDIEYVVVMGVNPGYSGQKFIPATSEKISVLSEMISSSEADCFIEFDGGLTIDNIDELEKLGVGVFVSGSSTFNSGDPKGTLAALCGK